jgi:hypothetical protein
VLTAAEEPASSLVIIVLLLNAKSMKMNCLIMSHGLLRSLKNRRAGGAHEFHFIKNTFI